MSSPFGFDIMFSIFPIIFILVFVLIMGVIIFTIVKSISRGIKNQNSPMLTVDCRIVSKRTQTGGGMNDTAHWTHYFVTFEVESGSRMEFQLDGEESGLLAEGDQGKVTFQGSRFVSFTRKIEA